MFTNDMKSTELAKEIGVKATLIVSALEELRGVQYKKGTTNVKLSADEAEKVKKAIGPQIVPPPTERPLEQAPGEKMPETGEALPASPEETNMKGAEEGGIYEPSEKQGIEQLVEPEHSGLGISEEEIVPEVKQSIPVAEEQEIELPDKFKKELEIEKVEKIKARPGMQKAFQAIKRIEPKKWLELKSTKKTKVKFKRAESTPQIPITAPRRKSIKLEEGTTVKEFADRIGQKIPDVIKKFMEMGYMPTVNQPVDMDAAVLIAESFGIKIESVAAEQVEVVEEVVEDYDYVIPRPPVVTIMGHVDHGKTSLLDAIRETKVTETEAGGITQHIGAYKVSLLGKDITFLDTPGHEAFTALRARGAKVTDVVVLVVAADDGVMPQTIEAINHAKAANVSIVVAINKVDKPEANTSKVKNELAEHGVVSEEWGGQNIFVEVSAKKRIGIERLLEMILLQAEVMELKSNPKKHAKGTIIEARLDRGRGPIATVLIQSGTLRIGDAFVAGTSSGKVRALIDDTGKKIYEAGPSTPVEVIGFSDVPTAGDVFNCVEDEKRARQIALARLHKQRLAEIARRGKLNLEEVYAKIQEGQIKELNIIIKGDVQGSVEAIKKALEDITHPEVKVRVIHASVGGINESDVMLATASNAIIIGFNVRPELKASQTAEKEGVDIRLYTIIYDAIENVKKALEGLLEPTFKERILGRAEVRQTFQASRLGTIAGCYVIDGLISRTNDSIRVIRDNIVIYDGKLSSLKRFREDVKEVQTGYECGVMIENFNDLKVGDILENYTIEKFVTKLA
ncbi:MAG: translation initiation factor IF-2 [Dissulfurispiraceae bacterium]